MFADISANADPVALDYADPLAPFAAEFVTGARKFIYLDGNSLGRPPHVVREAIRRVVDDEWTEQLINAWDDWIDLPYIAGDRLADSVLGAGPGEVLVSDSTSLNLYKLAAAALDAAPPGRNVLVTDDDNFPTDRYIMQGLAQRHGMRLRTVHSDINTGIDPRALAEAVGDDTAVVCLSHVAYRSGALADMAAITDAVHEAGALMLWDLCHSVGVVPIELAACGVDLAVGCTYKYLNAGPGAPAFLYVRRDLQASLRQPIWGWFSQQAQFHMAADYSPVDGIGRFAVGTPPIVGVAAVDAAVSVTERAGIAAIRDKSLRLGAYAQARFDERLSDRGFGLASPRDPAARGGHLTIEHPMASKISQAMREVDVIPDYRDPDRIRLGFAPLYNGFAEIREAIERIASIVESERYHGYTRGRVT